MILLEIKGIIKTIFLHVVYLCRGLGCVEQDSVAGGSGVSRQLVGFSCHHVGPREGTQGSAASTFTHGATTERRGLTLESSSLHSHASSRQGAALYLDRIQGSRRP